jgi:signal transduction histidine kinase
MLVIGKATDDGHWDPTGGAEIDGWVLGGVAAITGGVALRRRYPLLALALVLLPAISPSGTATFTIALALPAYLYGLRMVRAVPALVLLTVLLIVGIPMVQLIGKPISESGGVPNWVLPYLLMVVVPWGVGRYHRQRRALAAAGWDRAEHLEREQHLIADQVRFRERARIAEDMHDSLGHELSLLAVRAAVLEVAPELSERHRVAVGELRASAGQATARLHEIIGVLREAGGRPEDVRLEPAEEGVPALVDRAADSGLRVELHGREAAAALSGDLARTAHRVVQESLTNAAKYAPGAAVSVTVRTVPSGTEVAVVNARPTAGDGGGGSGSDDGSASGSSSGSGSGLAALRERVRLTGGTLRTGATADGGFTVTAGFPE